jgi:hypothetical protein
MAAPTSGTHSSRVVNEHREGESERVAVEGPLGLADDHGVEVAARAAERLEELGRFRSA